MENQQACAFDRFASSLDVILRARYPLIVVTTQEEPRFRRIIETLMQSERHAAKGLFWWSRTKGLRNVDGTNERSVGPETAEATAALDFIAAADRGIFVMADFAPFAEDVLVQRQLRELAWGIGDKPVSVIFVGATFPDVPSLAKEVTHLDLSLPDEREVGKLVTRRVENLRANPNATVKVDTKAHEQIVSALLGLGEAEITNVLAKASIRFKGLSGDIIPMLLDEKKDAIRQIGSLTYSHPEPLSSLGGYANLRKLLTEAAVTFTPEARKYGVEPSKGVLLVGLPGCGKDLTKKIASGIFGRPLLDLDMGSIMGEGGGIIGSAAQTMKRALSLATTLQCVLGISEFEKGVGGMASSAQTDGGETARTIAMLLNWMQEQSGVFVFATANDVRQLAPEQTRQGRFSQIVFVDLPTREDRADIFRVHLTKRGREFHESAYHDFADVSKGFSGAEIEAAVKGAILDGYIGKTEVTIAHVIARCKSIRPTSEVKREQIVEIRKWAADHLAVDAVSGTPVASGERSLEI